MAQWSELMRREVRDLRIGGRIVFGSGQECALTGEMISSLTIEEGADGALVPGCVLCASCTLDLVNDEGQWFDGGACLGWNELIGATILPELGVVEKGETQLRPLGVFQVERALCLEGEARMRLQASDSIGHELAEVFRDELDYPCSLQKVWEHAVSQTRYAWSGEVPNGERTIDAAPDWKEASLRTALGYIACAAGCFVKVDREGTLRLCPVWNEAAAVHGVNPQSYLKLERDNAVYGPVDALKLKPCGAEEEKVYCVDGESGLFALSVSENPLFQAEAPGLDELARGMLAQVAGFRSTALDFSWRGDPELGIGNRMELADTYGGLHTGVLTRQTLRFSAAGFSAACSCATPQDDNSGVRRAITPEGGLNAAALTGAIDGGLIRVGSITAGKLAAGSVTAEKIAAGALDTITLEAVSAKLEKLSASDIETDRLAAALAAFTVLAAGTAEFDFATVEHLVSSAMNLEAGVAGQVMIRNLAVEYAQMVGAAIGKLCIKASDGNYYAIDVSENGNVSATKTTLSESEIAAGRTDGGKVILETSITARQLNTGNLLATYALVNRIDAARVDVDELFAREAFVSLLRTCKIVGEKSITMIAGEAEKASHTYRREDFPTGRDYVRPGDLLVKSSGGETWQAVDLSGLGLQFYIDEDCGLHYSLDDEIGGYGFEFKNHELYADGLAFTLYEDGSWEVPYAWERVRDGEMLRAVEFATVYDSETPPEDAPAAGKLWLDRSLTPPLLRRWLGTGTDTSDLSNWEIVNDTATIEAAQAEIAARQAALEAEQRNTATFLRLDFDTVRIGKQGVTSEFQIDPWGAGVAIAGKVFSRFEADRVRFGNMEMRRPAAGGLMLDAIDSTMEVAL